MSVYSETKNIVEQGYGETVVKTVIAESYLDLFTVDAGISSMNILNIEEITKQLEGDSGAIQTDEINLKINEAAIKCQQDRDAFEFIEAGFTPTIPRYTAVFIQPSNPSQASEAPFIGKLSAEKDSEDLVWTSAPYNPETNPLQSYKLKAEPFSTLEEVTLDHLVNGDISEEFPEGQYIPNGIEDDWETANVKDRYGYFLRPGNRTLKINNIVSLNAVLRKITDNFTSVIANKGLGTINIVYDRSPIDGYFLPARWAHIWPHYPSHVGSPRYVRCRNPDFPDMMNNTIYIPNSMNESEFMTFTGDAQTLVIDPDSKIITQITNEAGQQYMIFADGVDISCFQIGEYISIINTTNPENNGVFPITYLNEEYHAVKATNADCISESPTNATATLAKETIWVNYDIIKSAHIETAYEYDLDKAKDNAWTNRVTYFIDMIYALARTFGLIAKVYYTDSTTIHISFIRRADFIGTEIFINGVTTFSEKIMPITDDEDKQQKGNGFYYANDGFYVYRCLVSKGHTGFDAIEEDEKDVGKIKNVPFTFPFGFLTEYTLYSKDRNFTERHLKSGARDILLTIAPTVCKFSVGHDPSGVAYKFEQARMPHNHYFFDGNTHNVDRQYKHTISQHSAIYMFVKKMVGTEEADDERDVYWTPAAKYLIQMDGEDKEFDSLTDYCNTLILRDEKYYSAEAEMEVPFLSGFSHATTGVNPHWSNLQLGSKYTKDDFTYIVEKITYTPEELLTKISMKAEGRYSDIGVPTPAGMSLTQTSGADNSLLYKDLTTGIETAGEMIAQGNPVIRDTDGLIYNALSQSCHAGKICGFALNEASQLSDDIIVKKTGKLFYESPEIDFEGNIGKRLFLRSDLVGPSSWNLSLTKLTEGTSLDLFVDCAQILDSHTLDYDFKHEFVFE